MFDPEGMPDSTIASKSVGSLFYTADAGALKNETPLNCLNEQPLHSNLALLQKIKLVSQQCQNPGRTRVIYS